MNLLFELLLLPFTILYTKLRKIKKTIRSNIGTVFVFLWICIVILIISAKITVLLKYSDQEMQSNQSIDANWFVEMLQYLNTFTVYPYNKCGVPPTVNYISTNDTSGRLFRQPTTTKCVGNYTLIILVTSNITNFAQRTLIRQTWGNHLRSTDDNRTHTAKIYFLIGRPLEASNNEFQENMARNLSCESKLFRDLVFVDVHEHHSNITSKMKHGFKWVLRSCTFQYLLSVHDDVYVNVPRLFRFLFHVDTPKKDLYTGNVRLSTRVLRTGKYGVSKTIFRKNVYARYCSGAGFVLSRDSLLTMLANSIHVQLLEKYDAYFGELALKSGIDTLHNGHFRTREQIGSCWSDENLILFHPVISVSCMLTLLTNQIIDEKENWGGINLKER